MDLLYLGLEPIILNG